MIDYTYITAHKEDYITKVFTFVAFFYQDLTKQKKKKPFFFTWSRPVVELKEVLHSKPKLTCLVHDLKTITTFFFFK